MTMRILRPGLGRLLLLAVLITPGCARSEDGAAVRADVDVVGIRGRVERVFDGDSFVMRSDGRKVEIRVFGIDAPEKGQPFSKKARARSRALLEGEDVIVEVTTPRDAYGRVVGNVYLGDGLNYAQVIVGEGLAWQYRRYSKDPAVARLEREARQARRGLWYDENPEPPWRYRRRKRRESGWRGAPTLDRYALALRPVRSASH